MAEGNNKDKGKMTMEEAGRKGGKENNFFYYRIMC